MNRWPRETREFKLLPEWSEWRRWFDGRWLDVPTSKHVQLPPEICGHRATEQRRVVSLTQPMTDVIRVSCTSEASLWSQLLDYYTGILWCSPSAYNKCMKIFFGYNRRYSVTQLLLELGLPSWNTLIANSQSVCQVMAELWEQTYVSFAYARFIIVFLCSLVICLYIVCAAMYF